MKISNLVVDLSYKEIKERRWRIPRLWRNGKKLLFVDYLISHDGIVLRKTRGSNNTYPGREVKIRLSHKGYSGVNLYLEGKQYVIFFHRLMWETWKGRIPEELEINHKYGIKTNNNLEKDLEIITHKQNIRHAMKIGLSHTEEHRKNASRKMKGKRFTKEAREKMSKAKTGEKHPMYGKHLIKETREKISKKLSGEKNYKAKLSQKEVDKIKYFSYIKKLTQQKIADRFKVSRSCINNIIQGYKWNPNHLTKEELKKGVNH